MTGKPACIRFRATSASARALWIARFFHVLMLVLLVGTGRGFWAGQAGSGGVIVVALLLAYEHSLVSATNLSKLNAAFFTMNGVISVVFLIFIAGDLLLKNSAEGETPSGQPADAGATFTYCHFGRGLRYYQG